MMPDTRPPPNRKPLLKAVLAGLGAAFLIAAAAAQESWAYPVGAAFLLAAVFVGRRPW
jgi:hypothetical protein